MQENARKGVLARPAPWRALALAAGMLLGACGGGGGGTQAGSDNALQTLRSDNLGETRTLAVARLCDPTGCYMAWRVVDSDGDGVCDADELVAGTDPHDPLSKPSLRVVAELGGKSTLPSFEAGLGVFAVYPEQMQAMLQSYYKGHGKDVLEQLTAFPLHHARGDALSRAGISARLLADNGIDPDRDGFTIGLDRPTASNLPGRRVGGIEMRLVSADGADGGTKPKSDDDELVPLPKLPPEKKELDELVPLSKIPPAAPKPKKAKGGDFVMEPWYVNPDADTGATEPTAEQMKALERLRGATIRTIENAGLPDLGDTKVIAAAATRRTLIMLVDPLIADAPSMALEPRFGTAQPETVRDDLPLPGLPAGGVVNGGGTDCREGCVGTP